MDAEVGPGEFDAIVGVAGVDDQVRKEALVGRNDACIPRWEAEAVQDTVGGPLECLAPEQWAHRNHPSMVGDGVGNAGDGEDRPDRERGVGGPDHDDVGVVEGVEDPGCRPRRLSSDEAHLVDRIGVSPVHEVLLEGEPAVVGAELGPEAVVGGGHHGHREPVGSAQPSGHLRERDALAEPTGPSQVGGEVTIPERETSVAAEALEGLHHGGGVPVDAPSRLPLDPGEGVGDGVEVGRDVEPEHPLVVAHVHHDGEGRAGCEQGPRHSGTADTTREECDLHRREDRTSGRSDFGPLTRDGPTLLLGVPGLVIHNDAVMSDAPSAAPSVTAVILATDAGRLGSVVAALGAQSFAPSQVVVVGGGSAIDSAASALGLPRYSEVAMLRDELAAEVSHVWLLHDDVLPHEDALSALLIDGTRIGAAVVGSKLVREGSRELESIGGLTDAFCHPVSVIEEGELDQGQYDVIRDVAYLPSASLLVRRDLFRGLGGLDRMLPPESAGIDFAQRARLAGARVAIVPSSEVVHLGACVEGVPRWREDAGQFRSLLKAYSAISLVWALPAALLIRLLIVLARLVTGRPVAALDPFKALAWNVKNVGSLIEGRRQLRVARNVGDEELFRFQVRGSIALNEVGSEIVEALRAPLASSSAVLEWAEERSGGRSAAVLGVGLAAWFLAVRGIVFDGLPVGGWTLPPAEEWRSVLDAWSGGWNPVGLGSDGPPHPSAVLLALATSVVGSGAGASVTLLSAGLGLLGAYRVSRAIGATQWVSLGASVIGTLGAATWVAGSAASWPGVLALGIVPWAVLAVVRPLPSSRRGAVAMVARSGLAAWVLAALVPGAVVLPLLVGVLAVIAGSRWTAALVGLVVSVLGLPALGPWAVWNSPESILGAGDAVGWSLPIWVSAGLALAWLASLTGPLWKGGAIGGVLLGGGALLARGFVDGREASTAGAVAAGLGMLFVSLGALGRLRTTDGFRERMVSFAGVLGVLVALLPVALVIGSGTMGLAATTAVADRLDYLEARDRGVGERALLVGLELPGDSDMWEGRPIRVVDPRLTFDRAWQGSPGAFDERLDAELRTLVEQPGLRGASLFEAFGIGWVMTPPDAELADALRGRLDVVELSFEEVSVFEHVDPAPVATSIAGPWVWGPEGWTGPASADVTLRINPTERFELIDGAVDGKLGRVVVESDPFLASLAFWGQVAGAILLVGSFAGRSRA